MANELTFQVGADTNPAEKALSDFTKVAQKSGAEIADKFSGAVNKGIGDAFGNIRNQIIAFIGVKAIFDKAVSAIEGSIKAAAEQEAAINKLNFAMQSNGTYTAAAAAEMQVFADTIQKTTKFQDDQIISALALAESFGVTNEQARSMVKAATELNARFGTDLEAGVRKLGTTLDGTAAGFDKMGINTKKFTEDQLKAGAAIDEVNKKFGGSAASQLNTFEGVLANIGNRLNSFQATLGSIITQNPQLLAVFKEIGNIIGGFDEKLKNAGKTNAFGDFIIQALKFAEVMSQTVMPIIEVFVRGIGFTFRALTFAAAAVIDTFVQVGVAIGAVVTGIIDKLGVIGSVVGAFNTELGEKITSTISGFTEGANQQLQVFSETSSATVKQTFNDLNASAANVFNVDISTSTANLVAQLTAAAETAAPAAQRLADSIGGPLQEVAKQAEITAKAINQNINGSLASGISNGVQRITKDLIAGKNGFESFGKAILGIIGDMAIQMGTFFIAQGIAQLALASNPLTAGGAIIAAGVGLVALGTILKSIGGGGESGASAPTGGGGVAAGGGGVESTGGSGTAFAETEPAKPVTQVSVNVEGNILAGNREVGLELARQIQESFDTQGTVIAGAV